MRCRVNLQPAFILHSRPWRDSSLILDIFSRDYGSLRLLARGIKRSKTAFLGALSPFMPLLFSWSGKFDFPTLNKAEANGRACQLKPGLFLVGLYLNELLLKALETHNSYTKIYDCYCRTLALLEEGHEWRQTVISFEKELLQEIGYGFSLEKDNTFAPILDGQHYAFQFGVGFVKAAAKNSAAQLFSGETILALTSGDFKNGTELDNARMLLDVVWRAVLDGKPLKSAEILLHVSP